MKKLKKKKKKTIFDMLANLLIIVCLCIGSFCAYKIGEAYLEDKKDSKVHETTLFNVDAFNSVEVEEEKQATYKEKFQELKTMNEDFKGWIVFDSGLINQVLVQAGDNDFYLRRRFTDKSYSETGTVFLDKDANFNSMNIPIYGHHVEYNNKQMFTPLEQLFDENNYKENSTFSLYTETMKKNCVIVGVIYYDITAESVPYDYCYYSEEEFQNYIDYILNNRIYDTGEDISINDNLVTLQTCVRGKPNYRELVIAKEVSVEPLISDADIEENVNTNTDEYN